jgi:hypothetical protein
MKKNSTPEVSKTKKRTSKSRIKKSPPSFDFWRQWGRLDAALEKLADTLITWIKEETDEYSVEAFLTAHNIPRTRYYEYVRKNKRLKEAHEFALMALGARREKGALKNKLNAQTANFMMPHYDPNWKAMVEWRKEVSKPEEHATSAATQVIVKMEPFPPSDLVPEKKK